MAVKIIVASGKGGAGKSSFSSGISLALVEKGHSCLVIDCDIGQGCIEYMLSKPDSSLYNWGDAIEERCERDECVYKTKLCDFITAPAKNSENFTEDNFKNFVDHFDSAYEYIIFDSPAGTGGGFSLAAGCADKGIIISTPDEICAMAASRAADKLIDKGIEDTKLVINRFNRAPVTSGKLLNVDEMIDAVRIQLIGVIPEDKAVAYASTGGFIDMKDCPAKAAYSRIAERILGNKVNLVLNNSKKEKPSKFGTGAKILSIIAALIILFAGIFTADFILCSRFKTPVFARFTEVDETGEAHYSAGLYNCTVYKDNGNICYTSISIGKTKVASWGVVISD